MPQKYRKIVNILLQLVSIDWDVFNETAIKSYTLILITGI